MRKSLNLEVLKDIRTMTRKNPASRWLEFETTLEREQ
jgi:hypothetical protein